GPLRRDAGRDEIRPAHGLHSQEEVEHGALLVVASDVRDQWYVAQERAGAAVEPELQQNPDLLLGDPVGAALLDVGELPVADAVDLLPLHGQHELGHSFVATDDLEPGAEYLVHCPREQLRVGRRTGAADDHLALEHIVNGLLGSRVPGDHDAELVGRAADPLHLARIETHAGVAKQDLRRDRALHRTDHGAVLGGDLVNIVGRYDRAGTRSVLDHDVGPTGNMPHKVSSHRARREIVAATDVGADHDGDGLASVELSDRLRLRLLRKRHD